MRIISLATVLFAAIFAVVIGYRIDQATVTILAGVTVGFVAAAIITGGLAIMFIRMNRQPAQTARQSPIGDWAQPYHVQHPLPKPTAHQLPAPAGPQYDDTVTFTLKQPQRKWVAVDEVQR